MSKFIDAVEEVNGKMINESKLISFTIRLGDVSEGVGWEYDPEEQFLVTGDSIGEFIDNLKVEVKKREGQLGKKVEQLLRDNLTRTLNDKLEEILSGLAKNVTTKVKEPKEIKSVKINKDKKPKEELKEPKTEKK